MTILYTKWQVETCCAEYLFIAITETRRGGTSKGSIC